MCAAHPQSGFMGHFGWPMMKLALSKRKYWQFHPRVRRAGGKRTAEIVGRRYFPDWLAKFCLRFYGRR
jgi:hypothetical protein